MKIGIVSSYFYPWYGGITEHVYYQYKELKKRGHQVRLITPFDGGGMLDQQNDLIKTGKTVPFIVNGSVVKIPLFGRNKKDIDRILDDECFDIIHFHQPLFCLLCLSFLKRIGVRKKNKSPVPGVFATFHASGGGTERFLVNIFNPLLRRYRDMFDCKIAVSQASRDFISATLPGTYEIIPNGVDVERFSRETEIIPEFNDGVRNVLFVGRPEPRKNLSSLLRSMPLLKKYTAKPFRLIIVGDGVLTYYYKQKIPKGFEPYVVFVGGVSFRDLPRYYKSAHVFCSPATYGESFGIVLVEAMAAGVPTVAGDNSGYRKVISDGVNGFLVNPYDPDAIARTIAYVLDCDEVRERVAARGTLDSQIYSWSRIIDCIEPMYREYFDQAHEQIYLNQV